MRPDSPQWIAAKAEGDRAEIALASFFAERGWAAFKALGQADYDLQLQANVEVKHDLQAANTGNVAIEVAYRGQASGIVTSRAGWWAIVIGEEAVAMKTDELRLLVMAPGNRRVRGGDENRVELVLIALEKLRKPKKGVHWIKLPALAGAE
jgi:hypothetical protein